MCGVPIRISLALRSRLCAGADGTMITVNLMYTVCVDRRLLGECRWDIVSFRFVG